MICWRFGNVWDVLDAQFVNDSGQINAAETSLTGVCCHHIILQEPFTKFSIDAEYRVPSSHESREISIACFMRLQATHCWQPQYHCYWPFLSLYLVQMTNKLPLATTCRWTEVRCTLEKEEWASRLIIDFPNVMVREMLSPRAGHITVITVYILIYCNVAIHYACACYSLLLKHLLQFPIISPRPQGCRPIWSFPSHPRHIKLQQASRTLEFWRLVLM